MTLIQEDDVLEYSDIDEANRHKDLAISSSKEAVDNRDQEKKTDDSEDVEMTENEDPSLASQSRQNNSDAQLIPSFKDFMLKPVLIKALMDIEFEHPSEVQQQALPQALIGRDILCQGKSGSGKTAIFILSTLQNINLIRGEVSCAVLCHSRELAYQVNEEYKKFSKYMVDLITVASIGGTSIKNDGGVFKNKKKCPNIVVTTPGRLLVLVKNKIVDPTQLKTIVIDECDKVLSEEKMRNAFDEVFKLTLNEKQMMMFSATLSNEAKEICQKYTQNPLQIYIANEKKLILPRLKQYFFKVEEKRKTQKLTEILDDVNFNQVIIFVKSPKNAKLLATILNELNFTAITINGYTKTNLRLQNYKDFKENEVKILVTTDMFGRGLDFKRVNLAINYDLPISIDTFLHRVGRTGRFGSKGLAISFISNKKDEEMIENIQQRFDIRLQEAKNGEDICVI
ncbi:hypothetical protein TBLA_0B09205 [Henningerozyma blattae CBS 6284]|uniref:RNA helicase n=1 Tax=Henningerozyma blattae (strain ATCC 34711 / CBS 6284 / DSM 70876 / NBRC 10599 / NRRL Y-10934 / UCD 77-7) TaxID=1071380 RepID=I2H034_HENB6|nr:hypothetical protein TBLA_0B09205 [Tetrapisispora blattae CBS 6284]CCH59736.1 hypothetical protein TBLA_0B09205 [Tetrapisispora blattae CBS 6284]